ncbi:MAG: polynucleotide adenylyltransferase PcnB [Alcanivoracaceae bacterium]|jgi:poly(A) polymerase|nr:polynucleotide adenylyltransferase PcnB [Alcanivoracaceae bacterium]
MLRKIANYLTQPLGPVTRLLGRSSAPALPVPEIHSREHHDISRRDMSRAALNVLYGLNKGGFEAYLVGGCLRDILAGEKPKDFDVVTNATPEEVQKLFRRARVIGRRFKIVHVYFGQEVIEVATFRALSEPDEREESEHGMILRDNIYGSIEEDALRRDFTINALYYNIDNFALYDFMGSMEDIRRKRIRIIGDPDRRYREDPVRMLRAARFAAKMQFELDPATEKPIHQLGLSLHQVPAPRMFDELLKLFLTGHALASMKALQQLGLLEILIPESGKHLHDRDSGIIWQKLIEQACINTDIRIANERPVTPAFLFAVLLWPAVVARTEKHIEHGLPFAPARQKAAGQVIHAQNEITAIPKRFSQVIREIWDVQLRLDKRQGRHAEILVADQRFRAGYDFLLLREQAGEIEPGLGDWWTHYQEEDEHGRLEMVRQLGKSAGPAKKRRRRRRKPAGPA